MRIHPLQQKNVSRAVEVVRGTGVVRVVVIGSSLNLRCNPWSDLDIVLYGDLDGIQRAEVEMSILSCLDGEVDILWKQDILATNRIAEEIRRGVVVYEQAAEES